MFRKLRRRLVLINTVVTTIVLVIAFATIYIVAQGSAAKRSLPPREPGFSQQEKQVLDKQFHEERQASLDSLLVSLIVVGLVLEVAVVVISYVLAGVAIQPVREAYDKQKTFIANASHEIKTPLAAIAANLEAAEITNNPWLKNVENEVQALTALNNELLTLARTDSITTIPAATTVQVDAILQQVTAPFAPKLKRKKINLTTKVTPRTVSINVVEHDLQQVLTILVDNAIKYCDRNVTICYQNNSITIKNDGALLTNEQLARVFDRFYQADKTAEGAGLGLAIAKQVSENNQWELELTSDKQFTQATLKFK